MQIELGDTFRCRLFLLLVLFSGPLPFLVLFNVFGIGIKLMTSLKKRLAKQPHLIREYLIDIDFYLPRDNLFPFVLYAFCAIARSNEKYKMLTLNMCFSIETFFSIWYNKCVVTQKGGRK